MFLRISPSPPDCEESEPFASTIPIRPFGARCQIMCCNHAKFAFPAGGVPYCQRTSSTSLSAPQPERLKGGFADVKQRLKNMGCSSPHTKERYPVIQGPLLLLFCCILLPDQPGNLIGEAIDDLHPHAAVYIHAVDKEQEHFIGQLVRSKRPAGHAAGLRQFTVLAL